MKKLTLVLATAIICLSSKAQEDKGKTNETKDTIRIGGMIIVKKGKPRRDGDIEVNIGNHRKYKKNKNISTNWWILDLGFANYNDQTNYANAGSYLINRPGYPALDKNDFKLKAGKSINVNLWVFMQRVNLIKHHVNLKYGLGIELNNYRYKSVISYKEGGLVPYTANTQTNAAFIFRDSISFSKNKLAADYLTVPVMLNFASNPFNNKKGISLSVGVSAGYLYSQRNKQKSSERGKFKNKGDYDLERFKFSYVAELGLGPVRLYGSYSPNSIYEKSLDMRPYNIGFRFSNW
ncbi:MAG: outer membrane beta-barrel protein [Ferruginibacter sp.]